MIAYTGINGKTTRFAYGVSECDSGIWVAHWLANIVYKDVVRYPDVS